MIGGLVFFAGDMLFYFSTDGVDLKLTMGHCSDTRIIAAPDGNPSTCTPPSDAPLPR